MTIKEYTVTDKVLTYMKGYGRDLGHARIKMPYTVNQFSNLINETYEELKFKLKLTKRFINAPVCTICDFYRPHISNLKFKKELTRATHAFLYGNKKTFLFEVDNYYLLNPIIDLEFGPYKMNKIERDEVDYIQFKNLPLTMKPKLPRSPHTAITKQKLENDLTHAYFNWIASSQLPFNRMRQKDPTKWELNKDYKTYINKFNKIIDKYKGIDYSNFKRHLLGQVHSRIISDAINDQFECGEIYLKPIDKLRNLDDFHVKLLKEGKDKKHIQKYLGKIENSIHLYPITVFMIKRLANGLKKNFPKKCKNNMDSFSYFK